MTEYSDTNILKSIQYGTLISLITDIRDDDKKSEFSDLEIEFVSSLSDEPYTNDIIDRLAQYDSEERESLIIQFINEEKTNNLEQINSKLEFIEESSSDNVQQAVNDLTLLDTAYYQSFFKFANGSHSVYEIQDSDDILQEVSESANTSKEAQTLFENKVRNSGTIDDIYADAASEFTSPIIGDVGYEPKPRLIKFESPNRVYIEFWSEGSPESVYDATRGKKIHYNTLKRTVVRIQIENNILEYSSTDKTENHRDTIIGYLGDTFSFSKEIASDGGSMVLQSQNDLERIDIKTEDLTTVISELGTISTLESFDGVNATVDYSSIEKRNVQEEPTRDKALEDRAIRRVNTQMLFDFTDKSNPEFIHPSFVKGSFDFLPDADVYDYIEAITKQTEYDNVDYITVSLHEENDTVRIDKERLTPNARASVFKLLSNKLGWHNGQ